MEGGKYIESHCSVLPKNRIETFTFFERCKVYIDFYPTGQSVKILAHGLKTRVQFSVGVKIQLSECYA